MSRVLAWAVCILGLAVAPVAANAPSGPVDGRAAAARAPVPPADMAPAGSQNGTGLLAVLPDARVTGESSSFPDLTGWVVDHAGMFTDGERRNLTQTLSELSDTTTHQVVLVTMPSLGGRDVRRYANELGRLWNLGYNGAHNGAIILVAPNEHLVTFEVGDDLKGVLTETVTNAIIDNTIIPKSAAGDIVGGIREAVKYTALALDRYTRGFPVTSIAPLLQRRVETALRACPQDAVDSYERVEAPKILVGSEFGCRWSDAHSLSGEDMTKEALRLCQADWGLECTVIKSSPEPVVDTSSPPPIVSIVQCANTAKPDIAIAACTAVLTLEEETEATYADALTNRGLAYYYKGDPGSAVADWDEAARRLPILMIYFDGEPRHVQASEAAKSLGLRSGPSPSLTIGLRLRERFSNAVLDLNHRDYARAFTELKRLSLLGFAAAQAKLGMMYLEGNGVPRDLVAANWWLYLAAENGDAPAMVTLGTNLETGNGTAKDERAAAKWFRRAAGQGHGNATPLAKAAEARLDSSASAPAPLKGRVTLTKLIAVDANLSQRTLRAIFSGDFVAHRRELATLSAKSIRMPELHIDYDLPGLDGTPVAEHVTYRDIELLGLANGVAKSTSMGSMSIVIEGAFDVTLGKISTGTLDLAGMLNLYLPAEDGLSAAFKTIFRNLTIEGGILNTATRRCEIGRASVAEFQARPTRTGRGEMNAFAGAESAGTMSLDVALHAAKLEAEYLDAIEFSPSTWEGFHCAAVDPNGRLFSYGIGNVELGMLGRGRFPAITVSDIKITSPADIAHLVIDKLVLKGIDLSGPIAALKGLSDGDDVYLWRAANGRRLIPQFEGIALTGMKLSGPDENAPAKWGEASLASIDVALGGYANVLPTRASISALHFKTNDKAGILNDLGVPLAQVSKLGDWDVDVSASLSAKWKAEQEINVDVSLAGVDLGTIALSADLGKATAAMFTGDWTTLRALTLKGARFDAKDSGMMLVLLRQLASNAGKELPAFRNTVSGWTQGAMLLALGATPQVQKLCASLAAFIAGGKSLSVRVAAKNKDGIGLDAISPLFEGHPTALSSELTIESGAK